MTEQTVDTEKETKPPVKPEKESKPLEFKLRSVKEKPTRKYKKGSKYDPLLDAFMKGEDKLVQVSIQGVDSNYLRTQLNKRIEKRKLSVKTSVVTSKLFLEKI